MAGSWLDTLVFSCSGDGGRSGSNTSTLPSDLCLSPNHCHLHGTPLSHFRCESFKASNVIPENEQFLRGSHSMGRDRFEPSVRLGDHCGSGRNSSKNILWRNYCFVGANSWCGVL